MADHTKEPCRVLHCSCEHAYQDETRGKGMRLHNPCKPISTGGPVRWRCSVCGKVKD